MLFGFVESWLLWRLAKNYPLTLAIATVGAHASKHFSNHKFFCLVIIIYLILIKFSKPQTRKKSIFYMSLVVVAFLAFRAIILKNGKHYSRIPIYF